MVMARVERETPSGQEGTLLRTTLSLSTSLVVAKHMLRYNIQVLFMRCGPENVMSSSVIKTSVKSYESLFLDSNSLQHRFRFRLYWTFELRTETEI
ncbi:hypothetical protein F8388_023570 [Cannabis sativa]|uniref:Uncharacterized protein n=1 Tax=Cannabis sativa TaxID=3483 RepID=A0A7J6G9B5_CANSA|nr:hypothetical protein F8388_023570 [Cannabis sativa]